MTDGGGCLVGIVGNVVEVIDYAGGQGCNPEAAECSVRWQDLVSHNNLVVESRSSGRGYDDLHAKR